MMLVAGCSFTDPTWQDAIPWSVQLSAQQPVYIVAKAGMGIKGICTETLDFLKGLQKVDTIVIMLPTLWRIDIEVDEETYLCNSMVDLLIAKDTNFDIASAARRKWLTSGGLHYDRNTEQSSYFTFLYKHQGFLVILKEHLRSLQQLLNYCKTNQIQYVITAIKDPLQQLDGLEYISAEVYRLLEEVEYDSWFKFNGLFVDEFLKTDQHPTTEQHKLLCDALSQELSTLSSNVRYI